MDRLFELLLGRSPPSAGTIRLAGVDRADRYSLSRKVGILFLEDALYKRQSRLANLALHSRLYGLGGVALVFVLSARWFVHWDLALLAAFLGAAFAVGLGLLLVALCENPATLNLWVLLAFMALLAPVLLVGLARTTLPAWIQSIAPWTPAVAIARLVGLATTGAIPAGDVARNAAILGGGALVLYGLVAWRVRASDR